MPQRTVALMLLKAITRMDFTQFFHHSTRVTLAMIDAVAMDGSNRSPSTTGVCGSLSPAIRRLPSTSTWASDSMSASTARCRANIVAQ
jgi:hypothetical protein